MYKAIRFLPLCIARGMLFPALGIVAVIATVIYAVSKTAEAEKE